MPAHPTLFRHVMLALAGAGFDIRPLGRRLRDAILRTHRAEFAAGLEQAGLAQRRMQEDFAALEGRSASLEQALAEARSNCMTAIAALEQAAEPRLAAVTVQISAVTAGLCAVTRDLHSAAAERDELQQRCLLLEQLLTGTAAARPPGAARATARLPSPAVAVIMPSHNRADFIGEALASVLAQSFQDWELIVVDDGSTDGTDAVVAGFADPRIRYVWQERARGAHARNRGIAATSAPIIAYLDNDNLWYPDFLSRAVDCLATEPEVDLVYGALVSDWHGLDRRRILWKPFDRAALLAGNFIDTSTIVHRRSLVARYGGWEPDIDRLTDWDLLLRYTADKPARAVNVLAVNYRKCDDQRVTDTMPVGPAEVAIRRKWFPPKSLLRRPRVLYVVWHYPQLSETYVETELLCMQAWGVHVEIWRTAAGVSLYPTNVPIHDGTLAEAIAASRPDILHVHWISFGHTQRETLAASGLPVTVRLHGFEVTREGLALWLGYDWVKALYGFPVQIAESGLADARLKSVPVSFDTSLFKAGASKDRRLVVRTSAGITSKDLEIFLAAARRLPEYRFVLVVATCFEREGYIDHLKSLNESQGNPVELLCDVPRKAVAALVKDAGIFVHTMHLPGHPEGTPVGQPTSVSEAMATGCYCLVRDLPGLTGMVGEAGATYRDLDQLIDAISATRDWTEGAWKAVQHRAIDRAYRNHADVLVLQRLFNDWVELSAGLAVPPEEPCTDSRATNATLVSAPDSSHA